LHSTVAPESQGSSISTQNTPYQAAHMKMLGMEGEGKLDVPGYNTCSVTTQIFHNHDVYGF